MMIEFLKENMNKSPKEIMENTIKNRRESINFSKNVKKPEEGGKQLIKTNKTIQDLKMEIEAIKNPN